MQRIEGGEGVLSGALAAYAAPNTPPEKQSVAVAVHLATSEDGDAHERFDADKAVRLGAASRATAARRTPIAKKKKKKPPTVQLGLEWVAVADLRDNAWRKEHMHAFPHSVLAARLMKAL